MLSVEIHWSTNFLCEKLWSIVGTHKMLGPWRTIKAHRNCHPAKLVIWLLTTMCERHPTTTANYDILVNLIKTFFYYRLTYEPCRLPSCISRRHHMPARDTPILLNLRPTLEEFVGEICCWLFRLLPFASWTLKPSNFRLGRIKRIIVGFCEKNKLN